MGTSELHWMRKHMGDIAWVAKRCVAAYTLLPAQRQAFDHAQSVAHEMAIGLRTCSYDNVCDAVNTLCTACRDGLPADSMPQCQGRASWDVPCDLILKQHQVQ